MMASMMIGRKLMVSDGVMPKRFWPQPHWNTATCAPKAAATDSRKPMIDLIGTRMVRKANVSRMNARPTTTTRKIGSAQDSLAETSMFDAVVPPIRMFAPVLPSIAARLSRRVCTRSAVAGSLGPEFGITRISAVAVLRGHRGHLRRRRASWPAPPAICGCPPRCGRPVGDDQQRAVEAGAEALGGEVVGLARGVAGGLRRPAGQAELDRQAGTPARPAGRSRR